MGAREKDFTKPDDMELCCGAVCNPLAKTEYVQTLETTVKNLRDVIEYTRIQNTDCACGLRACSACQQNRELSEVVEHTDKIINNF
jgi:hypothetical protein